MAISTLSSLAADAFKGNRNLWGSGTTSLRGRLNTIISKVNDMIADMNAGDFDVLDVGSGTGSYYGGSDSWFSVDGTNPPTFSSFRIQDQNDGSYVTVTCTSGTLSA